MRQALMYPRKKQDPKKPISKEDLHVRPNLVIQLCNEYMSVQSMYASLFGSGIKHSSWRVHTSCVEFDVLVMLPYNTLSVKERKPSDVKDS